jgi:cytochrome c-type biogenesis protein CcmF
MFVDIGYIALIIAFVVSSYTVVASFGGGLRRIPELAVSGRHALYTLPFILLVSVAALMYAFVNNDFSVAYVAENSNLAMPQVYTWVALYAGNAGSLLFIALVFGVLASIAALTIRRSLPHTTPFAIGVMALVMTFFLGIIVFMANPLERLPITPADGAGINPLLIHFGMFIHPPVQMAGLISVAIPFSIAIGAMLAGRGGRDEWVDLGRIWGLISWLILTLGLLLGSWWAYTILGWGGYWAWDPVENSALMPWLAMTAFIHSVMVQRRQGMFRMWNMVIIIIAFTLAQMGMFINRGGPVPSVHSFAQSAMGWLFLMFMGFTLLGSLAAFFWRMDSLRSRGRLESMLSREAMFLLQNVLFLAVAAITLWGSIFPLFSEVLNNNTVTVGEPFYNRIAGPVLLAILVVMGIGPFFPWRRATPKNLLRALTVPIAAGALTGVIVAAIGVRQPVAAIAITVCAIAAAGIFNEWFRGTRSRMHKGEAVWTAFGRLIASNRPRYGGYIVHLGILMLAIGAIGSSFYGTQRDVALAPGESLTVEGYTINYIDSEIVQFPDREQQTARFELYKGDDYVGLMRPARTFYRDFRIGATTAAIKSNPIEDFYVIPSEFSDDGGAVFRILVNPLVWWMWASGPVMVLGTVFALLPQRRPSVVSVRLPKGSVTV